MPKSCIAFLLLFCISTTSIFHVYAISDAENQAIIDLYNSWPSLKGGNPPFSWATFDPTAPASNSTACSLIGVLCQNGHIFNIVLPSITLSAPNTSLPVSIGNLVYLQVLDLTGIGLTFLPPAISNLVSLKSLRLCSNQLSIIPSLAALTNLQELCLGNNPTLSITFSMENMTSLEFLMLENTQLRAVPAGLNSSSSLKELYLSNSTITEPPDTSTMTSLSVLDLSENMLQTGLSSPSAQFQYLDVSEESMSSIIGIPSFSNVDVSSTGNLWLYGIPSCATASQNLTSSATAILLGNCYVWLFKPGTNSDQLNACLEDLKQVPSCQNGTLPSTYCPGTAPSSEFICSVIGWRANTSISGTGIVIPPGTNVTVQGNLNLNSTLIISGLNSSITVTGCANVSTVQVTLTQADIDALQQNGGGNRTLLSQLGQNCSLAASSIPVSLDSPNYCKKVSYSQNTGNAGLLSVTLTVQGPNSCSNLWWIILASVLGGVALLAAVIVLLVIFNTKFRNVVRPYSKGRKKEADDAVR